MISVFTTSRAIAIVMEGIEHHDQNEHDIDHAPQKSVQNSRPIVMRVSSNGGPLSGSAGCLDGQQFSQGTRAVDDIVGHGVVAAVVDAEIRAALLDAFDQFPKRAAVRSRS